MRAVSPPMTTLGWIGRISLPCACSTSASVVSNDDSCSSVLIVGKTSRISPPLCASSAPWGVNQPESTGIVERDPRLLVELAQRGGPQRGVALALVAVDRAAGEDPHAAHEPGLGIALDEQQLERLGSASQQDDGRGQARGGRGGSG